MPTPYRVVFRLPVALSWQGCLYGPLKTSATQVRFNGDWQVSSQPDNTENLVTQIPEVALEGLHPRRVHDIKMDVSLDDRRPSESGRVHTCSYRLALFTDFQRIVTQGTKLVLESDESLIRRSAKIFLSRSKRQELIHLLEDLGTRIDGPAETSESDAARVVKAFRERLTNVEDAADQLAQALIEAGVLEPRLQLVLQHAEQAHVEKNTARLQAKIDERLQQARNELNSLEKKKDEMQQDFEAQRQAQREELHQELAQKRQDFERECQAVKERLESQRNELDRQRELLSGNLSAVARELTERRDELVNQFLAIYPLLQQLNLIAPPGILPMPAGSPATGTVAPTPVGSPAIESNVPAPAGRPPLQLAVFVRGAGTPAPVTEEQFFERFCEHVESSGYKHRRLDLAGFHLSVKCNDLTILGGSPGTGKSSLPRLYAEALIGEEYAVGSGRYLQIGVSPSWLDMRDLLGQTNALDRCFQPAECGLYPLLIRAQEEEANCGLDTRPYLVCIDEMNLAQVEHYFSGFIQALERPHGQREIRCFTPELVAPSDPFASWPILRLPRALRFVGTVNFDETTRQLSQRMLDRSNLIRLLPRYVLEAELPRLVEPRGPAITLRQVRDWVNESAGLDRSLGELLDSLREPLARLGCPLNPRRYQAIRRVLGNTPASICPPKQALDLQIAQRILPQVRNLFRPGAREALKALRRFLEVHQADFTESMEMLDEIEDREMAGDLFARGGEE